MDMNTDIDPTDEIGCEEAPGFRDAEDAFEDAAFAAAFDAAAFEDAAFEDADETAALVLADAERDLRMGRWCANASGLDPSSL